MRTRRTPARVAKRDRIVALQRLAGHTEADNARRLAERLRTLTAEEHRLAQISGYLAEYTQSSPGAQASVTIRSLRSGRGFLERLCAAVDEQRGTVDYQRQKVEQQTQQWREARARTRSLEKLAERLGAQDQEGRDRREQGRLDEISTSRGGSSQKV
jgi:flagellar FliJ protein